MSQKLRIILVTAPVSAPSNWKYESNLLLSHKLARFVATHMEAHVYLLVSDSGDASFLPDVAGVTIRPVKGMIPSKLIHGAGAIPELGEVINVIREVGADLIVALNARLAGFLGCLLDGDGLRRMGNVDAPLLLWDIAPIGYDVIERGKESGGAINSTGYLAADHVWCASESQLKAAGTEVIRNFGYAAAQAFSDKARAYAVAIDREYIESCIDRGQEKRSTFTIHIGGRWSASNNYPTVATAVFKLKAAGADVALLNTGMVSTGGAFEKAVAETGIEVVTGLSQEQMWNLAYTCHAGVLSQDVQAMPGMPLEQLAAGLPLLVRSTERTPDVLRHYPLVWTSVDELMGLIVDVRDNYDYSVAQAMDWFEDNWQQFDVSIVLPALDRIRVNLEGLSVPYELDDSGLLRLSPRGRSLFFVQSSMFDRTLARREANRLGQHEEDIHNPLPIYKVVPETTGENQDDTSVTAVPE